MSIRSWYIAIVVVVLSGIVWLGVRQVGLFSVEVVHPMRGPAVQAVYATGTVEPTVMMPIAARATARLMELNVDEGSRIKKNQVLARLEDSDLQSAIVQLQAQESYAKKTYERNALMLKTKTISQEAYERTKSDWEAAKAATAKAQAEAGFMTLVAPADGLIIRRDGEIGQLIPASQPVFWLYCCAPLRISAEVDEEDIALVQVGQQVLIRADAFAGKVFNGTVQSITPKGDPIARSYRVRIQFSQEVPLQIGMTAETNIIISERPDALLLPVAAISKNKVWIVNDGTLSEKTVSVGTRGPEKVEIREGVTEQDMVAVTQDPALRVGQRVRPILVPQEK